MCTAVTRSTDVEGNGGGYEVEVLSGRGHGGGSTRQMLQNGGPRACGKTQNRLVGEVARVESVVNELREPALRTAKELKPAARGFVGRHMIGKLARRCG